VELKFTFFHTWHFTAF